MEARSEGGLKNGELLQRARAAGFEVFVTGDQGLQDQQNLTQTGLFVVVLVAVSNALEDLRPCLPAALAAIGSARAGEVASRPLLNTGGGQEFLGRAP